MACVPHHPIAAFSYDEDCLYLNIFAPKPKVCVCRGLQDWATHNVACLQSELPGGYPVLVFIHGGGFCAGWTAQFGYENVTDNLVSKGIVIVTIQYRLGPMGE